jgi:hypothetical protein
MATKFVKAFVKPNPLDQDDAQAIVAQQEGALVTVRNTGVGDTTARGQVAVNPVGRLFLTANEGFFTNASTDVRAVITAQPKDLDDDPLNNNKYFSRVEQLHNATKDELRWHFKSTAQKPMPLHLHVVFDHEEGQHAPQGPQAEFKVLLHRYTESGQKLLVCEHKAAPTWAHGRLGLSFEVPSVEKGLFQVAIHPTLNAVAAETFSVVRAVVEQQSKLIVIRERWRPEACHLNFKCSELAPNADVDAWVFTVQKLAGDTAYIAITTPFGYVGILINQDGKVELKDGLNFSLWGHKRNTPEPPLHQLPHILCIEDPKAKFGTFGHEGHGVKVKDFPHLWSDNTTQAYTFALTTEPDQDHEFEDGRLHAFTVSVWDENSQPKQFRRFAEARFFTELHPHHVNLMLRGFVEVAGAADRNRTGDSRRVVKFTGCAHERLSNTWREIDQILIPKDGPSNKFRQVRKARYFAAGMGGVLQNKQRSNDRWARLPGTPSQVPEFVAHLNEIWKPVVYPEIRNCTIKNETVTFSIKIPDTAQENRVYLFAGRQDGMSLANKWPFNHDSQEIFAPGVREVDVPLKDFNLLTLTEPRSKRANDLVARVLVRNEIRQVWSGVGFDFKIISSKL